MTNFVPMKDLRITLVQTSLFWEDRSANVDLLTQKLSAVADTDLIVLPETFSTGFSMNPQLAETTDGEAVAWMKQMAASKNCAVTGSLIIREDDHLYNRLLWVTPDGRLQTYDKRHLFSISAEPEIFTCGTERLVVEWQGWKICPLVCYDLRFPVWSRNLNAAYDVLIYVANWPERRAQAWKYLLVARAIENQCYTVGVNRVGNDGHDVYHAGDSMVLDPLGNVLFHQQHVEEVYTLLLSREELQKVREQLPFLKDADDFELNPKRKIIAH